MIKLRKAETVFVGAIQNDSEILFTQVGIVFLFFPPMDRQCCKADARKIMYGNFVSNSLKIRIFYI